MDASDHYLPLVVCPNPDHDTVKRHFQVNARDGLVHCFANCGISGTFEHAIAMIEGCQKREARKIILKHQRAHRPTPRKSKASPRPDAIVPAHLLSYERFIPQSGIEYLERRGISERAISEWEIGWDADEKRIVIPAKDEGGHVRFLIKRGIFPRQHPKYLYTPEKSVTGWGKTDLLFGACGIDLAVVRSQGLILVEGGLDTARLSDIGLRNAGAILGTGISRQQRRVIVRLNPVRVFYMFDKDLAGITNILKAYQALRKYPGFVCRYPKGVSDPGEIRTAKEAQQILSRAVPVAKFLNDAGLSPSGIRPKGASVGYEATR